MDNAERQTTIRDTNFSNNAPIWLVSRGPLKIQDCNFNVSPHIVRPTNVYALSRLRAVPIHFDVSPFRAFFDPNDPSLNKNRIGVDVANQSSSAGRLPHVGFLPDPSLSKPITGEQATAILAKEGALTGSDNAVAVQGLIPMQVLGPDDYKLIKLTSTEFYTVGEPYNQNWSATRGGACLRVDDASRFFPGQELLLGARDTTKTYRTHGWSSDLYPIVVVGVLPADNWLLVIPRHRDGLDGTVGDLHTGTVLDSPPLDVQTLI